jgi:mono/diheme cytochrome c family protein
MRLNKNWIISIAFLCLIACSGSEKGSDPSTTNTGSIEGNADDPMLNIGIGPIAKVELSSSIDNVLAANGKTIYDLKCTACHKVTEKFIGPPPAGIMDRRNPAWIMNMILNPEEMTLKDPIARELFIEYNSAPMANQSLTEEEARAILEYFRTI